MKKLSSQQLRQVLNFLHQRLSYREIERLTGTSISTISRVQSAVVQLGRSIQDILKIEDEALVELIYPRPQTKQLEPDWEKIHDKLRRKSVTLQMLFAEYQNSTSGQTYTYSSFCRRYANWTQVNGLRSAQGNVLRIPAERMEIDFAGDKFEWVDRDGVIQNSKFFVASLPYSNMLYTEAFPDEKQSAWLTGIINALEYFGGVPQTLVIDNAKALMRVPNWDEGEVQAALASLCRYYSMEPWACRPGKPKQKNRVEAAVNDVERWIMAQMSLNGLVFAIDLGDLNRQIRKRLDEINLKPFQGRGIKGCRRSKYEQEERQHMAPLPKQPYEFGEWKLLTSDKAHCVRIASDHGHRYSTPASYASKKVAVQICYDSIKLYDAYTHDCIGTHIRHTNQSGEKTHILEEHLTAAEKHYRKTPSDWIALFVQRSVPENLAEEFVTYLKEGKGGFPSGQLCGAVLKLFKRFSPFTVRKAMATALEEKQVRLSYMKRLCEYFEAVQARNASLDLQSTPSSISSVTTHENIRNDYE